LFVSNVREPALRPEKSGLRHLSFLTGLVLAFAAFAILTNIALAQTQPQMFSSTVPQSGFAGFIPPEGVPLTGPSPYTFGPQVQDCVSIESITVTLTLFDGDTGSGPFDTERNDLTLGLDGIDTGILLNGFRDSETDTRTITGIPNNAAQILAALKADGQLVGTIIDRTPNDNFVGIPTFDTTLQITCATVTPAPIAQESGQEAESGDVTQTVQIVNE
jgi:hypothetical protein